MHEKKIYSSVNYLELTSLFKIICSANKSYLVLVEICAKNTTLQFFDSLWPSPPKKKKLTLVVSFPCDCSITDNFSYSKKSKPIAQV